MHRAVSSPTATSLTRSASSHQTAPQRPALCGEGQYPNLACFPAIQPVGQCFTCAALGRAAAERWTLTGQST
eukprot:3535211-Alexandrium_andersonii.AAC.1